MLKYVSCTSEDELLREALKQAKLILCTRLPIEFLPTVLESKGVISSIEYLHITGEGNSVDKSIKLLDQMGRKSIPLIQQFLDILRSDENFRGFGYLAEIVEKDFRRLVEEKKVPTRKGKQASKQSLIVIIVSMMIIAHQCKLHCVVSQIIKVNLYRVHLDVQLSRL